MDRVTTSKTALDLKIVDTLEHHKDLVFIVSHCPRCFELFKKVKEGQILTLENNNNEAGHQPAPSASTDDNKANTTPPPDKVGVKCYND